MTCGVVSGRCLISRGAEMWYERFQRYLAFWCLFIAGPVILIMCLPIYVEHFQNQWKRPAADQLEDRNQDPLSHSPITDH